MVIRFSGWTGDTALMVEHEFFRGRSAAPRVSESSRPRGAREAGPHGLNRLGQSGSDPARGALWAGDAGGARGSGKSGTAPSRAIERSRSVTISIKLRSAPMRSPDRSSNEPGAAGHRGAAAHRFIPEPAPTFWTGAGFR